MTDLVRISKFLSLVLRHKPDTIGLHLDAQGWAGIDELIAKARAGGVSLSRDVIIDVVRSSDKQRFALSGDGLQIRANQGHSVEVDLHLAPAMPPERLFHGTATRLLDMIRAEGLKRMSRQHVHLSPDEATAVKVGQRHGKPVVLVVAAGDMASEGHVFYKSANGVWLTDHVPTPFIKFPPS